MKKIFAIVLAVVLMLSMVACDAAMNEADGYYSSPSIGGVSGGTPTKGDIAEDKGAVEGGILDGDMEYAGEAAEGDKSESTSKPITAGLLTAGEWKDLENIDFWTSLLNRNDWYALMESRNLYPRNIKVVYVHDSANAPCYNATVELLGSDGSVLYSAKTDVSGHAYLFYGLNKESEAPAAVRVDSNIISELAEGVTDVLLSNGNSKIQALDLMFMIDTTGSMMDELSYLQRELEDVVIRVSEASGDILSIRVSVNFYRDDSDQYVVLPFDFSSDLGYVVDILSNQRADGGGDYPEAVHKALGNAVLEHQWRGNAVKLMFLVLDAPPHSEGEINGINKKIQNTVTEAARQGIRIIPVASSGVDTETEFLLRSYAAMTGGTYVFLTNHSGIGGDHLEPTIGQYEVEQLNDCLVRVISEYCGLSAPKSNNQNTVGYGTKIDFNASVAWANWSGDVKKISALALNADKLYVDGADRFPIYKCESVSELDYFKSFYADTFSMDGTWDEIGSFNDITCGFNDEFFKKNTLLLVYVDSNSCTPRFDVDSVVIINGDSLCVNIVQTNDPGDWDDAMCGWLIAVSVSREDIRGITVYNAVQK